MFSWIKSHREVVVSVIGAAILCLGFFALSDILKEIRSGDVHKALAAIEMRGWVAAVGFTAVSYLCLTLYDHLALKIIGLRVPYAIAAKAAAISYAISNTLGLSLLTGGSVRMRIYRRAGLAEGDVARIITLAAATFWSGIFVLFGLSLALEPTGIKVEGLAFPAALKWAVLAGTLLAIGAYLIWTARAQRSLRLFGARLPLPGPRLALAQLAVAAVDLAASSAVIFMLVPDLSLDLFPHFLAAYILALGVAVLTHSPGGLGVFEAMVFLLLPQMDKSNLAAALIGYRMIYYLLPFAVALVVLAIGEGKALRHRAAPVARIGQTVAISLAPLAMSGLVFAAGAILILTGAFPAIPARVETTLMIIPPALLDLSHLAASLLGTVLMLVAYGLYRRLDIAWMLAIGLLASGALAALARGLDFEEAGFLLMVTMLLIWTRGAFYRQTALTSERPNAGWLLAVATVLVISIFAGFFANKAVAYQDQLWWQIDPAGNAPRFLRATLGALVLLGALALRRLTRPRALPAITILDAHTWERGIQQTANTEAHLARTGDKAFLTSEHGDAFLMYRVRGRSFIAMGNPVGLQERWPELAWRFRDLVDRQGGRIAFYECGPEFLPLAVDLGLSIMKLGEEALVPLADFTLEGKTRANLRHAANRMEREGATFRVVEKDEVAALLPDLEVVSSEWLAEKKQREKQFSLGRFEAAYLTGAPVALIERDGEIFAFANLWPLPSKHELSFDLMRHRADAPPGTMDFLLSRMMLWGKEQGYAWFSLGVAPLSGIESRRLAPLWARMASLLFRYGERLYGYAGLRQYKEKFRPVWRPRYFVAPHGISMAAALIDVTMLVSAPSINPQPPAWEGGKRSPLAEPGSHQAAQPSQLISISELGLTS